MSSSKTEERQTRSKLILSILIELNFQDSIYNIYGKQQYTKKGKDKELHH